jgi:pyrroline-5-carboxylate reductase
MKILIVGAGNMGKTYIRSLLSSHFTLPADIYILDKNLVSEPFMKGIPTEQYFSVPNAQISKADIIILAVKPQDFEQLAAAMQPFIHAEQIILSIMAGITMASLSKHLGSERIVRSMPNLPAQVGMGMTVFTCSPLLDRKELFIVQNLLNTTGKSVYVEDEKMIDAATAISGSGPAYVYYFMEAMIQTAMGMGFSRAEAELMVAQTFMGAVNLHSKNDLSCQEWINRVASKGGTTEAAIKVFDEKTLHDGIASGLTAALLRARELGAAK